MKVLIIGLGSIAQKHIKALRELNANVELLALRSSKKASNQDGVLNIYSISNLNTLEIDFAIISNPTSAHADTIKQLIPYNIPLFIEKPIFDGLDNENIIEDVNKNNIVNYVACNLRFLDCLKFTKEYIENKRINEVNIYCGSYLPDWRPGRDYKTTYSANKNLGGGVHIDLIHEIDYAYWLFGKPQNVLKTASNKSSLDIDAFDYANYILNYKNFNTSIILNYFRRDPKRTLEIVLKNETIAVNLLKNEVYCNNILIYQSKKTVADTYFDQLNFFTKEILEKKRVFNNANEAYEILKICLQND
jgi:predicted dehydrogenase